MMMMMMMVTGRDAATNRRSSSSDIYRTDIQPPWISTQASCERTARLCVLCVTS